MIILNEKLPPELLDKCDSIVSSFYSGNQNPDGIGEIINWIGSKYWQLIESWKNTSSEWVIATIDLLRLSGSLNVGDFDPEDLSDDYKIRYARASLDDPSTNVAFFLFQIKSCLNETVVFVISGTYWGQGGWEFSFWGLFETEEIFMLDLLKDGRFWLVDVLGDITDKKLLSLLGGIQG